MIGRLNAGATLQQARAEMTVISTALDREFPRTNAGVRATVVPLRESLTGRARDALLLLFGAVGFVVLIACANVANLLLAKGTARQREFALRTALGANRSGLVRQLLTESLVLGVLGGTAGVALAHWGTRAIVALAPANLPNVDAIGIDVRVLTFAFLASLVSALLFGLAPALRFSRIDLQTGLADGARTGGPSSRTKRVRHGLIVAEVALATVLLVGAGLLMRSFARVLGVDPGFRAENVLSLQLFAWTKFPQPEQRVAFAEQTIDRIVASRR